jgi:hypothetical protein
MAQDGHTLPYRKSGNILRTSGQSVHRIGIILQSAKSVLAFSGFVVNQPRWMKRENVCNVPAKTMA